MKILFIVSSKCYGGMERILEKISYYMKNKGHEIVYMNLYTPQEYSQIEKEGLCWSPFNKTEKTYLACAKDYPKDKPIKKLLVDYILNKTASYGYKEICDVISKESRVDFLVVESPLWLLGAKRAANECDYHPITILWNHGSLNITKPKRQFINYLKQKIINYIYIKLCQKADYAFLISTGIAKKINKSKEKEKIRIIYNPIASDCIKEIVAPPKKTVFLYVGRLENNQKNLSFMLKALSRFPLEEWELIIIGSGPDEQKLKDEAKKYGIDRKIQWLGYRENPFDEIEEATCLLLTSRYEGFPLVLVEAIERGIPVLSSNCESGPDDIVINGVNGYLYESENENEFLKYLEKIVKEDLLLKRTEIPCTVYKYRETTVMEKIHEELLDIRKKSEKVG